MIRTGLAVVQFVFYSIVKKCHSLHTEMTLRIRLPIWTRPATQYCNCRQVVRRDLRKNKPSFDCNTDYHSCWCHHQVKSLPKRIFLLILRTKNFQISNECAERSESPRPMQASAVVQALTRFKAGCHDKVVVKLTILCRLTIYLTR